jgi:isocitrate lyase
VTPTGTGGQDCAIARALAFAPYSDVLECETASPGLAQAKAFIEAVPVAHPGKLIANNCSHCFNCINNLNNHEIARFQRELGAMG